MMELGLDWLGKVKQDTKGGASGDLYLFVNVHSHGFI